MRNYSYNFRILQITINVNLDNLNRLKILLILDFRYNCKIDLDLWSGKRDLNPRPLPWQGNALPTELFPRIDMIKL